MLALHTLDFSREEKAGKARGSYIRRRSLVYAVKSDRPALHTRARTRSSARAQVSARAPSKARA
eukprot:6176484-Pleurochrysis_carterae.AAC.6